MKYFLAVLVTIVLFSHVKGDWFSDQIGTTCLSYPRYRQSFCNLTYKQRATWVAALKLLRSTKVPGSSDNIYKSLVDMHSVISNSNPSHGTCIFFLWHRAFLFIMEDLIRYILYTNRASLNLTVDEACSFSCPHWPWEADAVVNASSNVYPQDSSCIWDYPELLGPRPTHPSPGQINSGAFCVGNWTTNFPSNNDPVHFYDPSYGTLTYSLKREFNIAYNMVYGPAQIMRMMKSLTNYCSFMSFIEGGPHSCVHLWLGYVSKSMSSPEDPIFWLNHGCIERIHTLFQDCHDHEFIDPSTITSTLYGANNPNPTGTTYKVDVYGKKCNIDLDTPLPFWWKCYMVGSSTNYTFVDIPWWRSTDFPTPRKLWALGYPGNPTRGWRNMMYTYEKDPLVETFGGSCCSPTWTYFPSPSSSNTVGKRDAEEKSENLGSSPTSPTSQTKSNTNSDKMYSQLSRQMSEMKKKGLCDTDAVEALAMQECINSPRPPYPPDFDDWLKMNGLVPESFIRICENGSDYSQDQGVVFSETTDSATRYAQVTVLGVIGYVIAGVVLLIAVIVGIVIIVRKKQKKVEKPSDEYLNM